MLGWTVNFYKSNQNDVDVTLKTLRELNDKILSWNILNMDGIDFINFNKIPNHRKIIMSGYPMLVIVKYKEIKDILPTWYKEHKKYWLEDAPLFINNEIISKLSDDDDIIIEAWDQS